MARSADPRESYLQVVAELREEGRWATQADVCRRLDRSSATISQTTVRLVRADLVRVHGNRRVELTATGLAETARALRRRRILECFLHDVVRLEWWLVADEAARLQHVVGAATETRIDALVRFPRYSPFGCPVPRSVGAPAPSETSPPRVDEHAPTALVALAATTDVPCRAIVRRIGQALRSDAAALRRLYDAGIVPGAAVTVRRDAAAPGPALVSLSSAVGRVALRPRSAADIAAEVTSGDTASV